MSNKNFQSSCPIPISDYPNILLAHGGGGKLMHRLIDNIVVPTFGQTSLKDLHDSAVLDFPKGKLAFTTDSFVVHPLFFPGGDIGDLAVNGTVNDLAMSGARPLYMSVGFIIEEGLSMESFWAVVQSIKRAGDQAGIKIVTGDTKVVDKGKGDGLFVNTSGIGVVEHIQQICPKNVQQGDVIIVNGDIARHGMAIMAVREGLEFDSSIESDTAAVNDLVQELVSEKVDIHCMRDLTRGGLASSLNEIAQASGSDIRIDESEIPVQENVRAACELLGFDPLYVACEGRFILIASQSNADKILKIMKKNSLGKDACVIGEIVEKGQGTVVMKSKIGASRVVDLLSGEQLPRIC